MKRLLILLPLLLLTVGCSTQYREADPQVSSDDLFTLIENIKAKSGSGVQALDVNFLAEGDMSTIYHAREGSGRPAMSVLAMLDMNVFDSSWNGVITPSNAIGLEAVDAVFIDTVDVNNVRSFMLLLTWRESDGVDRYFASTSIEGTAQFTDTDFAVAMLGANGETLVIRTNDLSEKYSNELASSIKLEIYVLEGDVEYYVGQISTMAGFGNLR